MVYINWKLSESVTTWHKCIKVVGGPKLIFWRSLEDLGPFGWGPRLGTPLTQVQPHCKTTTFLRIFLYYEYVVYIIWVFYDLLLHNFNNSKASSQVLFCLCVSFYSGCFKLLSFLIFVWDAPPVRKQHSIVCSCRWHVLPQSSHAWFRHISVLFDVLFFLFCLLL